MWIGYAVIVMWIQRQKNSFSRATYELCERAYMKISKLRDLDMDDYLIAKLNSEEEYQLESGAAKCTLTPNGDYIYLKDILAAGNVI